jgi:ADP-ribose pyrophosphatase YjhB (NUDIX family)
MNSIISTMSKMSLFCNPNLGGKQLKLVAKDDARNVHCFKAKDIASGLIPMPFRHPEFAKLYYKTINHVMYTKFSLISLFAQIRNHRVMRKCNEVIAKHEGKKLFTFTPEMNELDSRLSELIIQAKDLEIDPSIYLDESTDADDVEQCTNSWCLNQNTTRGKASDNIIVITDLDDIDWFVLIERQFGPGRAQAAWAGGFVDKDETFTEAAAREKNEEVGMDVSGNNNIKMTTTTTELPVIISNNWDPRAKFVEGMENGAVVTHYHFVHA